MFTLCLLSISHPSFGQNMADPLPHPLINIRASLLLFPPTPLITTEVQVYRKLSLQLESNFKDTHGFNLKYFKHSLMERDFFFVGLGFITNEALREDEKTVYLPYAGYGYAYRLGGNHQFTWDTRFGLGLLSNADTPTVFPIIKSGLGWVLHH